MELELKHIAPYLDHKLKMDVPKGYNFDGKNKGRGGSESCCRSKGEV